MGAHFGDNANSSNAVLRYANVNNEPSNANTNIGSSLRERAKKLAWAKGEDDLVDSCLTVHISSRTFVGSAEVCEKAHTGLVVIMTMGAKYETRRRCLGKVHQQRKH